MGGSKSVVLSVYLSCPGWFETLGTQPVGSMLASCRFLGRHFWDTDTAWRIFQKSPGLYCQASKRDLTLFEWIL